MENGFKRIKKIAKRVLPQITETRMSSTSANINTVVTTMGNDALSEFVVSSDMKHPSDIEEIVSDRTSFGCQFYDSDEDDEVCSDDSENVMEASTSFLSSMKDLEGIDPETRARLQVLFQAAGLVKTNPSDGGLVANQKLIRKLTSSVSEALDEAASALVKMREEQALQREEPISLNHPGKNTEAVAQQLLKQHGSSLGKATEDGESLLSMAASSGYYELCQVLLATNGDVDDRGTKGDCTPLMEAAAGGYVDIIRLLLHNKASINAKSTAGNTALHYAASGGHLKPVQILINAGAHVEAANENGHTPLMEAASVGHVSVANLLIENGAEVNTQSKEFKESALTLACYKGHTEMVQFLLNAGADLEHKTDEMHTALMEACIDGFVDVAKLLIDRGAEVNMIPESYESPLTLAACGGHVELANLLISKGAIVDQRNDEGYTPLMEAAREGHEEVSALLIDHGAEVNAITQESKETALTLACCSGFKNMADLLIKKGADIELGGLSPLIEAAQEGHLCLVKYLLNAGATVNAISQRGDTALSCACGNGHTAVAEVLLKAGSNMEHVSNNGRTPLMKAAKMGHLLTVQFLVRRGAAVNKATPDDEYTALSLACLGGHLKVVEFLLQSGANAAHKLKDGSTMLIEAAKGGHAQIVSLLLDWSAMLSSNSTPLEKNCDLWCVPKEHIAKRNQIKKALLQLESIPKHYVSADREEDAACLEKCCTRTSNAARNQMYQSLIERMDEVDDKILGRSVEETGGKDESCKNKLTQKGFEFKEGIRHDGDGCSGGIDSAVHDLSGSSSVSSSSSSSSSSSASEAEKFEDACFCCCASEKQEVSIERGESIAGMVESRKRACLDNFDGDSAFSLKAMRNLTCADISSQNFSPDATFDSSSNMHNRIIAKGHRKLPQQPKHATSQQRCQSLVTSPCPSEAEKGLTKQKQVSITEITSLKGDIFNLPKPQRYPESCHESPDMNKNQHLDTKRPKNSEQFHGKTKNSGVKTVDKTTSLLSIQSKTLTSRPKISNLEKIRNAKIAGNLSTILAHKVVESANLSIDKTIKNPTTREHSVFPGIEVNAQTETNHDTALTLASAGGHFDLVQLLLKKGADVEHRDKKGFTSLILASAAGHLQVVNILLEHGADTEAQLEQTKDTALSLACSGGRHEIAEALLKQGANREHRNASDYTPLCLAASAGHVSIVRLLLIHGAEINSRTSSRLGISPLMLASMNGHAAVVSLLLDMGGDVNAQIETNKNTALTLACFQGKHEVVALLADRKANLEHRAKKGLTPLMEAASGGFVEVGRVLIDRGADVSALHGSSTKDTALTIAADKGHYRFVELLLSRGAPVNARNKKGHTALWLACNGGHLEVIQLLIKHQADPDSCDARRTSCLMAAFKKGNIKVVKCLVKHVTQLPSDQECARCLSQIVNDKELLKKCQQCMDIIISAKERQAAEANKHANNLLMELALEQSLVENKKAAALRKREKRKQRKKDSKKTIDSSCQSNSLSMHADKLDIINSDNYLRNETSPCPLALPDLQTTQSQLNDKDCITSNNESQEICEKNSITESKSDSNSVHTASDNELDSNGSNSGDSSESIKQPERTEMAINKLSPKNNISGISDLDDFSLEKDMFKMSIRSRNSNRSSNSHNTSKNNSKASNASNKACSNSQVRSSGLQGHKIKEDDWKEVSRKCKKLNVPGRCISRIIGRGGCNINAVREASGAHIDLDKMKHCDDGIITIKGSQEATQIAMKLLEILIEDPEKDILSNLEQLVPSYKGGNVKGVKQPSTLSCSDIPKEISISAPSASKLPMKPPAVKSQEKEEAVQGGILPSKSQSSNENSRSISGPWFLPKDMPKISDCRSINKNGDEECLADNDNVASSSTSLNSPIPTQHFDENIKDITLQSEKSVSSTIPPSYNLIVGGDFSPFDNLLSKITEAVLQKSKDQKKDFASVAASCLSNGPMSSNALPSSSSTLAPGVVDSELQAKAPGFRRGNQLVKSSVTPSTIVEAAFPSSSVARKLDFGSIDEIGTSLGLDEPRGGKLFKPGVIGSGIPFNNKKNVQNENEFKFSAAIGSNLNPNAPNFTSVMTMKQYDSPLPFAHLGQSVVPSNSERTISGMPFGSLIENFPLPPPSNGQPSSFMFDYGPGNELWKFSSSETTAIQNGSYFMSNSSKADFPQFSLYNPSMNYLPEPNLPMGESACLPKEPYMFKDGYYKPFNGSAFMNGIFSTCSGMTNPFTSPSFTAFNSEATFNQQPDTSDHYSSPGPLTTLSASLYPLVANSMRHMGNSPLGAPSRQTRSPTLQGWQQLNS